MNVFLLPDLGEGLTSAEVVRWLVDVGDTVTVDQPVVEVETAKSVVELPCPYEGVVTARHGAPGEELPVGAELLRLTAAAEPTSGPVLVGYGTAPAAPGGAPQPTGPGPGLGLGGGPGASGAGPATAVAVVSPLVRRLARERGVDIHTVTGTGPGGLIMRADVLNASPHEGAAANPAGGPTPGAASGPASRAASPGSAGSCGAAAPAASSAGDPRGVPAGPLAAGGADAGFAGGVPAGGQAVAGSGSLPGPADAGRAPAAGGLGVGAAGPVGVAAGDPQGPAGSAAGGEVVGMRGVAWVMAERVGRSRREVADATCWVEADATGLVAARSAASVSTMALLARICVVGLRRYPQLNASVDMAARRIVRHGAVHLGFAAATDRGLLVPVVRDAQAMTTGALAAELRRLTEGARAGTLPPAELTGSTFTLNNYGVFGVDGSTPIINVPEAGMLGVGRIAEKPWAHEGRVALRSVVQLSLTFDHRVCDGAVAGGFLRFVADRVEQPLALLGDL
ncbi:dihydrolipoamide acetyltransferase family protein [Streptomyces mayteni]